MRQAPLLAIEGIRKAFAGVEVLRGISLDVPSGHALGLVGENGAGKSTLMNILGGNLRADAGSMSLAGASYAPCSSLEATRAGVAFIHQELNLFANLSIAENLFLTSFPTLNPLPFIDRNSLHNRAASLLRQVGLSLSPDTPVEALSAGEQQLVEFAKALATEARVLILDEPTTSLTRPETDRLFELIRRLRGQGLALIYISHNLQDVLALCDSVAVLRDGVCVARGPRDEFTADRIVTAMVGRSVTQLFPARAAPAGSSPLLEVRGLSQPGTVSDIHFTLGQGEVLGLSGLMGSGRSELARILFGLEPASEGEVLVEGRRIRPEPRTNLGQRLAFLTENRREEGLCLEASITDNIALVTLRQHARTPLGSIARDSLSRAVSAIREAVRITPSARGDAPARTLSGGNQQKVVLAKWLLAKPRILLLDEPTRGIDVGARAEIYQLIQELSSAGAGILLISSELEELIGLCDRILVMRRGVIAGEFKRGTFDRERILSCALGGDGQ